jgi:hypothetical protein
MLNQRHRPIIVALVALVLIWAMAFAGYKIAKNAEVTPEKVRAYAQSVNFGGLSGSERDAALKKLAAMLNALSYEDRQKLRMDHTAYKWFELMTEQEKGEFIDLTMPTGFKQMLGAFQDMPADKRQKVINQAMKQLKDAQAKMAADGGTPPQNTNSPVLSTELQQKVVKIGLQSYYSQSSAETRAELAPLMEEMQHTMESGRMMRPPQQ